MGIKRSDIFDLLNMFYKVLYFLLLIFHNLQYMGIKRSKHAKNVENAVER